MKSCNLWLILDLWPLKYPYANKSPNLFLQKCKQQHLDKLKEVKTPWVLAGALNGGHSMIAYLLPQLTKSNLLWFLLDFWLWPLKILPPTWTPLYIFRNASGSTEISSIHRKDSSKKNVVKTLACTESWYDAKLFKTGDEKVLNNKYPYFSNSLSSILTLVFLKDSVKYKVKNRAIGIKILK